MNGPEAVAATAQVVAHAPPSPAANQTSAAAAPSPNFAQLIMDGLAHVEAKVDTADALVRAFALDDAIPVHQVTIALEEARIAVELAAQVRARLVDGYREIMSMQL